MAAARHPEAHPLLPEFRARSPVASAVFGWLLYAGALLWLVGLLPNQPLEREAMVAAGGIGLLAAWRWSWGGLHFLRMLVYTRRVFPRLRAAADATRLPPSLAVIVTSYHMTPETNAAVYGRLLDELAAVQVPAVVVACITDPADVAVLGALFARRPDLAEGTALHLLAQAGTGKRTALVEALELVAALHLPPNGQVLLMDGDTLLAPGALAANCRLLASQPDVGAVTANNIPLVRGTSLAREWYRLRMAQRHVLMCSMSLSRRLLVLTGRFSLFRVPLITAPEMIRAVEHDSIEHWRLGRIAMVTGDDKSTWFVTLREGWRMLYVPDAGVYCIEELPGRGFLGSSIGLMGRWYGNMARNNLRALRLGRARLGAFTWLCLIDQRVSSWTAMSGPVMVMHAAVTSDGGIIVLYAIWVLVTRGILSQLGRLASGRFHPLFPFLLYYNQIIGGLIKIHAWHHPDRQGWTRQKLVPAAGGRRRPVALSNCWLALEAGVFLLLLALVQGAMDPLVHSGRPTGLGALFDTVPWPDSAQRLACGTPRAEPCASLSVPQLPTAQIRQIPPTGL